MRRLSFDPIKRSRAVVGLLIAGLIVFSAAPPPLAGSLPMPEPAAAGWNINFTEAAQEVGIHFQTAGEIHDPAGQDQDWPALPEIVGAGACWADFTGDGYDDLYIANQRYNDDNPYAVGYNDLFDPTNRFYLNNGDSTFTDHTVQAGLESRTFDYGCSGVDHDASGHVDLLVYGFGHIKLYRNNGNLTFTDITQEAGLDVSNACLPFECFSTCSAWADYNRNGLMDLFVCTFVESDMKDSGRGPAGQIAQHSFLFRNNGDGTFTEVAEAAGVQGIAADSGGSKSWSAVWFDADQSGWQDLYVANDMTPNEFYWNNWDGTFTRDDDAGLYDDRAGMGVAVGDSTRNGFGDLYFTHYQVQHNGYYENRGDGTFLDRSGEDGLAGDWAYVGWGTEFVDLDRDGHLDLVAVNGHTQWLYSDYDQKNLVFHQEPQEDGSTLWVDRSDDSGPGVLVKRVSRGAAFADFDLNGDMDVFIGNNANQSAQFLRGSGNTNHWLYVQPVQEGGNPHAIGARVIVEAGGVEQVREIHAGSSFLSQNSLLADFGVGQVHNVDRVTVEWPDGSTTSVEDVPVQRVIRIDKQTGGYITDTLSPVTEAVPTGEGGKDHWYRSEVLVDFEAEDRAIGPASGVAYTEYRLSGGPWQVVDDEELLIPAQDEGEHLLAYRSVDHVGNVERLRSLHIGIDLTPPEVAHEVDGAPGSNGWWLDGELRLSASDALSGVDKILHRVDGGEWTLYTQPVALDDGEQTIEYKAVDKAGNESPVQNVTVRVDGTPPEVVVLRPEAGMVYLGDEPAAGSGSGPAVVVSTPEAAGSGGTEFTFTVNAQDPVSGLDRVVFSLNDEPVMESMRPEGEVVWSWNTSTSPSGSYLFQVVAVDRAGNPSIANAALVLVGGTPGSAQETVSKGPSLYPWGASIWPDP